MAARGHTSMALLIIIYNNQNVSVCVSECECVCVCLSVCVCMCLCVSVCVFSAAYTFGHSSKCSDHYRFICFRGKHFLAQISNKTLNGSKFL